MSVRIKSRHTRVREPISDSNKHVYNFQTAVEKQLFENECVAQNKVYDFNSAAKTGGSLKRSRLENKRNRFLCIRIKDTHLLLHK